MIRHLIILALAAAFFIYLTLLNPQVVDVSVWKGVTYSIPASVLIIICLTIGFVVATLFNISKDLFMSFNIFRLRKRLSKEDRVKETLSEAFVISEEISAEAAYNFIEKNKVKDPYIAAVSGRFKRESGDIKEAKKIHSVLKKDYPESRYIFSEFLSDLFLEKRYNEVLAMLSDTDISKLTAFMLKIGMIAAKETMDLEKAYDFANRLLKLTNSQKAADFLLGVQIERLKKDADVKRIKRLLKKYPTNIPAIMSLVEFNSDRELLDIIKEAYRRTKNPLYLYLVEHKMTGEEKLDPLTVIKFAEGVLSEHKNDDAILFAASVYLKFGMYEEAWQVLESLSKESAYSRILKAKILKGLGRENESLKEIERAFDEAKVMRFVCYECRTVYDSVFIYCEKCKSFNSAYLEFV